MAFTVYVNRVNSVVTSTLGGTDPVSFDVPLAAWRQIDIVFHDDGVQVELPADTTIMVAARKTAVFDGPSLLTFVKFAQVSSGSSAHYVRDCLFDSAFLRATIGTAATMELSLQITWLTLGNPKEGRAYAFSVNAKNATARPSDVVPQQIPSIYRQIWVDPSFVDMAAAGFFAYGSIADAIAAANALTPAPDAGNPVYIRVGFMDDPGFAIDGNMLGFIFQGLHKDLTVIDSITVGFGGIGAAVNITFEKLTITAFNGDALGGNNIILNDAHVIAFEATGYPSTDTSNGVGYQFDGLGGILDLITIHGSTGSGATVNLNGLIEARTVRVKGRSGIPWGVNGGIGGTVAVGLKAVVDAIDCSGGLANSTHNGGNGGTITLSGGLIGENGSNLNVAGGIASGSGTNGAAGTITGLPATGGGGGSSGPANLITPYASLSTLAALATASGAVATGTVAAVIASSQLGFYQLQSSTAATATGIQRPADYNGSTNARAWIQLL